MKFIKVDKINEWLNLNTNITLEAGDSINLFRYYFYNDFEHITKNKTNIFTIEFYNGDNILKISNELESGRYEINPQDEEKDILKTIAKTINNQFDEDKFFINYDSVSDKVFYSSSYQFKIIKTDNQHINPLIFGFNDYDTIPISSLSNDGTYILKSNFIPIIETVRFLNLHLETDGGNIPSNYINSFSSHFIVDINKNKNNLIYNEQINNLQNITFSRNYTFSKIKLDFYNEIGDIININNVNIILSIDQKQK